MLSPFLFKEISNDPVLGLFSLQHQIFEVFTRIVEGQNSYIYLAGKKPSQTFVQCKRQYTLRQLNGRLEYRKTFGTIGHLCMFRIFDIRAVGIKIC